MSGFNDLTSLQQQLQDELAQLESGGNTADSSALYSYTADIDQALFNSAVSSNTNSYSASSNSNTTNSNTTDKDEK